MGAAATPTVTSSSSTYTDVDLRPVSRLDHTATNLSATSTVLRLCRRMASALTALLLTPAWQESSQTTTSRAASSPVWTFLLGVGSHDGPKCVRNDDSALMLWKAMVVNHLQTPARAGQ
jgi:hypothetical protein